MMKYKRGDRVRIISKSFGDTLAWVKERKGFYRWEDTGWIRRIELGTPNYYVVSYLPLDNKDYGGGDFYLEKDLVPYYENLPEELFEI